MATPLTPDFHDRLAEARDKWFRSRFRLYYRILVVASLFGVAVLAVQAALAQESQPRRIYVSGAVFALVCALISAYPLRLIAPRRAASERALLRASYIVSSVLAAALIFPADALSKIATTIYRELADSPTANLGPMAPWASCFILAHSLAALILPWRPRQAFLAYAIFAAVATPLMLIPSADSLSFKIVGFALVWTVGLPGVAIAAIRHLAFVRGFRVRALGEHLAETQQELTDARRLHDALFPVPILTGPIQLRFAYEPMRSIGGDFLYTHSAGGPALRAGASPDHTQSLSVVLIDVTGHGVPAALTVHRLHGELERLFGERPDADPGHILERLNSYLHHALAKHSVYATAICCRLTATPGATPGAGAGGGATLEFASAGHPPAFHRSSAGAIAPLDSTAFVLGAVPPDAFDAGAVTIAIAPGDSVILYTDGATESRDQSGKMLRVEGLAAMIGATPRGESDTGGAGDAPGAILRALTARRYGPPSDDTLVVELAFRPQPHAAPTT